MKRRVWSIVGCGLLAVCPSLGLGALASPAEASGRTAASVLLAHAIANAESAGWVHEVTVNAGGGHRVTMDDDIGTSSGRQVIDDNGGHMTVLVINGDAWVEGDTEALEHDLDAPSQDATELAGHWLSIPPSNQLFGPVSDAVTLQSDFKQDRISGPLKQAREVRINGTPAIPITGTLSNAPHHERVTATLYVSTGDQPLPIEFRASGHGLSTVTRWTDWGHAVLLGAPSGAVSLGSGSGGTS
jgi:hypothetical protein